MKRNKSFFLLLILASVTVNISGQYVKEEAPPLRERIFFAGNLGLQLGTYTNIQLAPSVGIWLLPRLSLAVGPTYQFYKDPLGKTDIYGIRTYSEFMLIRDFNNLVPIGYNAGFYTHIEYEGISLRKTYSIAPYKEDGRFMVNSALVGFGLSQNIGPRSAMTFTLLWVITDNEFGIYGNPEIRIGFMF
jgi:hypothetical protein